MKNLKLIFVFLLALTLVFALVSCGEPCTEHVDADKNGKCDKCEAEMTECAEHEDKDGNNICDKCGNSTEESAEKLILIKSGDVKFRFVMGTDLNDKAIDSLSAFVSNMKELGLTVDVVDNSSEPDDSVIEVLVGSVTTRGEKYILNRLDYGKTGYIIKEIDNKIVIFGGAASTTAEVLDKFILEYLGYVDENSKMNNVSISSSQWKEKKQTEFQISSVTLKGEPILDYTIAYDLENAEHKVAATMFQDALYERAGIYLPFVNITEASEKSIVIKKVPIGEAGNRGFRVFVKDMQLVIECAHDNMIDIAFEHFIAKILYTKETLSFGANYTFDYEVSILRYEDFGAKGDGVTNDYAAIKATHDRANLGGQTVYGRADAVYYISSTQTEKGTYESILIETNTNWCGAKIIIDDRGIDLNENNPLGTTFVFEIASSKTPTITVNELLTKINANGGITYGTTNIGVELEYDVMLLLYNSKQNVYIRYGGNQNDGSSTRDVILVHKNGDIDPSTPILFEYPELTNVMIERLDEDPILVQNATIESIGNDTNIGKGASAYLSRGIRVTRPNTTIKNLVHVITGEIPMGTPVDAVTGEIVEGYHYGGKLGDKGVGNIINSTTGQPVTDGSIVPFMGYAHTAFINVANTSNIDIIGCTFQARTYYKQGTYDISVTRSNDIVFKECLQSNFWYNHATKEFFTLRSEAPSTAVPNVSGNPCWGVMGSNGAKNVVFDNTKLVRFDAHEGMVNGKIINGSEVSMLRITGGGELLIQDSTVYYASSSAVILLREDYGATFKGTITLKDITIVKIKADDPGDPPIALFRANTANHIFGNKCYFPNVIIDNVKFVDKSGKPCLTELYLASDSGKVENGAFQIPDGSYDENKKVTAFYYRGVNDPIVHLADGIYYYNIKDASGNIIKTIEIPNVNPYNPPEFIKVINNSENGYTVYVKDYSFWNNTTFENVEVRQP